jgi:phosphate starvation-inducible PhoH-like protein
MPSRIPASVRAEAEKQQIDLAFDNNRLASQLYGEFDQNLALIERRLGVDARARGNMVTLAGPPPALALARRVLESLYDRLLEGHDLVQGDVDGAIRMAEAEEAQLPLPTLDESSRMRLARIATRKKSVVARTPMQDAYIRAFDRCQLVFGLGPRAPERPISPSPSPRRCWSAATWSASFSRARRWRPASGWVSFRAT